MQLSDYTYQQRQPTWCPGCGNFGVLQALKKTFAAEEMPPEDIVVTYDIGCGGNMVNDLKVCGFASLHGRSIPVAIGAKRGNPDLTVLAQCGDGGLLNEGVNHLVHAAQRDEDITVIVHNNLVFALTTGQTSSASPKNMVTKSYPEGTPYPPLDALSLAAVGGAGFLARSYALKINETTNIIRAALNHSGFSIVEVTMPCLIWSEKYTDDYQEKFYWLDEPAANKEERQKLIDQKEQLPLGIIWQE